MSPPTNARHYKSNLQGEVDGAALYGALAKAESDPKFAEVYAKLAAVENAHADFWQKHLTRVGAGRAVARPVPRSRAVGWIASSHPK